MNIAIFSDQELATMLAALRYWQNDLDDPSIASEFLDHFVDHPPLTAEEIDDLCEKLNA